VGERLSNQVDRRKCLLRRGGPKPECREKIVTGRGVVGGRRKMEIKVKQIPTTPGERTHNIIKND